MNPLTDRLKSIFAAMSGSPLPQRTVEALPADLSARVFHETAGLGLSGDNGVGKSELIRRINRQAVSDGNYAVVHLDPPGDGAKACVADNLDFSEEVAKRTFYHAPGNTSLPMFTTNPLAVDPERYQTQYELTAALDCRAHYTAALFPRVFGDEGWDQTPQMYTVSTAETRTLARLQKPLGAIDLFFDEHPLHETFLTNLPFPGVRRQFQNYLEAKPEERFKLTGSAHNRIKALLFSTPIMTSMVSSTQGCWSTRTVLDNREYHYFDLAPYGNLEDFHRKLILQFILADILFTVMSTPRELRKPLLVICDEAPVICAGSELVMTNILPQTRKMLLRWLFAWQGVFRWEGAEENRLLRTITGQCNMAYFRHSDPRDARFAADQTTLGMKTGARVKLAHYEEEPVLSHQELVTLIDKAVSSQWAEMGAETQGGATHFDEQWSFSQGVTRSKERGRGGAHTEAQETSHTDSSQVGQADADSTMEQTAVGKVPLSRQGKVSTTNSADGVADQHSRSQADQSTWKVSESEANKEDRGRGGSRGHANNWTVSKQTQRAGAQSVTYKQQFRPVYVWKERLRCLELFSLDDERELAAGDYKKLQTGEFILDVAAREPVRCRFDLLYNCLARAPEALADAWAKFLDSLRGREIYHQPEQLLAELPRKHIALLNELAQLNLQSTQSISADPLVVESGAKNPSVGI